MPNRPTPYIGRFAPSPSGPLHFGSLVAALASYLDARSQGGLWHLRIEDLDPPREQPGADQLIIDTLSAHGFEPDGDILYQSKRHALYEEALNQLQSSGAVFRCPCNRQWLKQHPGQHTEACQTQSFDLNAPVAIRLKGNHQSYRWHDGQLGEQSFDLSEDYVLKRKDGLFAYQLAVVVDDYEQSISHVVRGNDLISSTPPQIALFEALYDYVPHFTHIPVITNEHGQKLSKQHGARGILNKEAIDNLVLAGTALGLPIPKSKTSPREILLYFRDSWLTRPKMTISSIPERSLSRDT